MKELSANIVNISASVGESIEVLILGILIHIGCA